MSAAPPDPHELFERLKELDHAHVARPGRSRLRSGMALALSLGFLRRAAPRSCSPPRAPGIPWPSIARSRGSLPSPGSVTPR